MTSAVDLCKRHSELKSTRSSWESHWIEVAERVLPRQNEFFNQQTPGAKRTELIYDSTGPIALGKFAAVMEALLTPRTQTWHKLKPRNGALKENDKVKLWFERQNATLFSQRYSPLANFASQAHEGYMSLGAFGTAAMFIDKAPFGPLRYKSCHLSQIYVAENAWGQIDKVHREFKHTARQLVQRFKNLPEKVTKAAVAKPETEFTVLHCIEPNGDVQLGKKDYTGMKWASYYCLLEETFMIEQGGYRTMPYAVSRYVTAPSEIYGRSPSMDALPDIKLLNEATKVTHRQWHQALEPPWLVADDGVLAVQTRPGALNRGAIDEQGRPRIMPLISGANFEVSAELTQQKRDTINDVYLVRILQIILENPQMTATQVLEIAQQKGILLAPPMGRQQTEFLGNMIPREMDLLFQAGMLEDAPEELTDGEYDIEYESPLALAQKASQGVAVLRTIEGIMPLAQVVGPSAFDKFDVDACIEIIGESNGMPERAWASDEQIEATRDQRAKQQAAAAAMQAVPAGADALNKLAQAKATTQQANQQGATVH